MEGKKNSKTICNFFSKNLLFIIYLIILDIIKAIAFTLIVVQSGFMWYEMSVLSTWTLKTKINLCLLIGVLILYFLFIYSSMRSIIRKQQTSHYFLIFLETLQLLILILNILIYINNYVIQY
jgi:type VI protein secretion system component VasK